MKTILKILLICTLFTNVLLAHKSQVIKEATLSKLPFSNAKVLKYLKTNSKINVSNKIRNYKNEIWYETNEGYIRKDFIKESDILLNMDIIRDKKYHTVYDKNIVLESINIRKEPSLISKKIGITNQEDIIGLIRKVNVKDCGIWYYTSRKGYISFNQVKPIFPDFPTIYINDLECKNLKKKDNSDYDKSTHDLIVIDHKDNEDQDEDQDKNEDKNILNNSNKDKKLFIGLSLGFTKLSKNKIDKKGSIVSANPIDDNTLNLNIEIGYNYSKNYFSTLSYTQAFYDDIDTYDYLISFNKRFSYSYSPYIGILGGVSYIKLTKSHLNLSIPDKRGRSVALGLQAGIEKNISQYFKLFVNYKYLKVEHKTNLLINTVKSEISRDHFNSLNFGLRYSFY